MRIEYWCDLRASVQWDIIIVAIVTDNSKAQMIVLVFDGPDSFQ